MEDDAKMCTERAEQEIERGGDQWSADKAELTRLARKAWPYDLYPEESDDDPLCVALEHNEVTVQHEFEEDSVGFKLTHPKAPEAALIMLKFLAGELDMRAIVDGAELGKAHDKAVAEYTRLLLMLEKRDHDLRVARASHEDTIREMNAMRDAARTVVAEMRAEHVMKSYDAGRCVAAERLDDWVFSIERLILRSPFPGEDE